MPFSQKTAGLFTKKSGSTRGEYLFSRQKELVLDLVQPQPGERILDIGCGKGDKLQIFNDKWSSLTGIDPSKDKLEIARQKFGDRAELVYGDIYDLPFSDNEFDVVTIINFLEVVDHPQKVIEEAVRVSRNRIFIGFLNNYSIFGTRQKLKETFGFPIWQKINFFTFSQIKRMVRDTAGETATKWGSVIYFPAIVYDFFEELEEVFYIRKNPFGAFAGMTFPVKYTYRTVQSPIMNSLQLKAGANSAAPEVVREMLRHVDR